MVASFKATAFFVFCYFSLLNVVLSLSIARPPCPPARIFISGDFDQYLKCLVFLTFPIKEMPTPEERCQALEAVVNQMNAALNETQARFLAAETELKELDTEISQTVFLAVMMGDLNGVLLGEHMHVGLLERRGV